MRPRPSKLSGSSLSRALQPLVAQRIRRPASTRQNAGSSPAEGTAPARLWARVDRSQYSPGGCWPWTGYRTPKGYGTIQCGSKKTGNRAPIQTHRLAYLVGVGALADGQVVRHRCNNAICCNPAHLIPGTQFDNSRDMVDADRQAKGVDNGNSKLTEPEVSEIRALRAAGCKTVTLGLRFGISPSLVSQVCRGRLWRHVPPAAGHKSEVRS